MKRAASNILLTLAVVTSVATAGCNERPAGAPATAVRPQAALYAGVEEEPVAGAGELVGRVSLRGTVPAAPHLEISGTACGHGQPAGIPDEAVVATAEGRLSNVLVHLRGAPASEGSRTATVLNQVNCRYVPHVVALQVGQSLRIQSADAVLHNVHGMASVNPAFNLAQTSPGASTQLDAFKAAEIFPVRCDVHPWMKAWIGVFPDPYFAVTQTNGEFRIRGIPPGTYMLVAWHERFGELTQQVTVADGRPMSVSFEYARP